MTAISNEAPHIGADVVSAQDFIDISKSEEDEDALLAQEWHSYVCSEIGRVSGSDQVIVDYEVHGRQELRIGLLWNICEITTYTKKDENTLSAVTENKLQLGGKVLELDPEVRSHIKSQYQDSLQASKKPSGWHRDK